MNKLILRLGIPLLIVLIAMIMVVAPAGAKPAAQEGDDDDLVAKGQYLAEITGCIGCHTPIDERGQQVPNMVAAGGYPFALGEQGTVFTKNITPDEETGVGSWTDQEIKDAITTGVSPDGLHLHPIMPYFFFNKMADDDLDAIVAWMRSLPPIKNEVPRQEIMQIGPIPRVDAPAKAPDPSDTEARAAYLFSALLACNDCHTPLDPETQTPVQDMYFAGGQPYEGPWGIVYAANITPHEETGIGAWSDADIERIFRSGVRPNGRHVVLMPWQDYKNFTADDMQAVIYYLRNSVPAVDNEVPAPSLNEGFEVFEEVATAEATEPSVIAEGPGDEPMPIPVINLILVIGAVALAAAVVIYIMTQLRRSS
jgi:mono/diheme cytochrome c family protein